MKILAAGDLHGDITQAKRLATKAIEENVDAIFLTGDLVSESIDGIVGPFADTKKKVFLIHGNHEGFDVIEFLAQKYGVTNLHGKQTIIDGVGVFACGGANIGIDALSEDQIFHYLKESAAGLSGKKIMISHVHPANSQMEKFSSFIPGSSGVEKAIQELKPDVVLCSHVHEAEGIEEELHGSKVINVGRSGRIIHME